MTAPGRSAFQGSLLTDLLVRIGASIACLVLLLLILAIRAGGCVLFLQVFATVAFPVVVAVIIAPAASGLLSHPFGGIFHAGGRSSGTGPALSVAEAMRIQGDSGGAFERLRQTVAEHPQELGAYIGMVRIALQDLDDPDLARESLSLGLRTLKGQADRNRLASEYRDAGEKARARPHSSTPEDARAAAGPDFHDLGPLEP